MSTHDIKGHVVIVDDDMDHLLKKHSWRVHSTGKGKLYVMASGWDSQHKKNRTLYLHKLVMPGEFQVDHKNGDTLDNRRANLRFATGSQNMANGKRRRTSKNKYRGVTYRKERDKWRACITVNRQRIFLGYFGSEKDAAIAYNEAAKSAWGEYAVLNMT